MENKTPKQIVKEVYPDAICIAQKDYQGNLQYYFIEPDWGNSNVLSTGLTEDLAWQNASEKLKQTQNA